MLHQIFASNFNDRQRVSAAPRDIDATYATGGLLVRQGHSVVDESSLKPAASWMNQVLSLRVLPDVFA